MKNLAQIRDGLVGIGCSCAEIVSGCNSYQNRDISVDSLNDLVEACRQILKSAEEVRELAIESKVDVGLDREGKTEPSNDPPSDSICKCGHGQSKHMPKVFSDSSGCCIFCECLEWQNA